METSAWLEPPAPRVPAMVQAPRRKRVWSFFSTAHKIQQISPKGRQRHHLFAFCLSWSVSPQAPPWLFVGLQGLVTGWR